MPSGTRRLRQTKTDKQKRGYVAIHIYIKNSIKAIVKFCMYIVSYQKSKLKKKNNRSVNDMNKTVIIVIIKIFL